MLSKWTKKKIIDKKSLISDFHLIKKGLNPKIITRLDNIGANNNNVQCR